MLFKISSLEPVTLSIASKGAPSSRIFSPKKPFLPNVFPFLVFFTVGQSVISFPLLNASKAS